MEDHDLGGAEQTEIMTFLSLLLGGFVVRREEKRENWEVMLGFGIAKLVWWMHWAINGNVF